MYNLTKPQKLIYDMEKYAGGSVATICGSILINGEKDTDALVNAVNELYRINDALRIKITEKDGVPYQQVTEYREKNINILRFNNKSELKGYAQNYAKEPMDFYGELCNIEIVVLNNEYGILVKMHHIISDAWTFALIGSQFNTLLNGEKPESYSYLDYIATEQKYTQSKRYQKDKEYYIEQFKKCDEVTYISDKQVKSYSADRKTFVIAKEQTAKIAEYAKENNTSLFALFMTVLGVYVSRIKMNTEKFYIGTAVLNRNGIAEQNTAGMFINTVPVLSELENSATFKENLEKTSENLMAMFRHQKFNYGDVLKTLRSEFDFSGNLYDVMLSYQNSQTTVENSHTEWYACGMQTESLAMHIDDRDSEGILKIHYDYQTEKFTEKEIERMHTHLFNLLFDAMSEDKKIIRLNMLSAGEKRTLLCDFNDTKADYPKDKCVHQLFEEQVKKTPDKTAVIACDKTLTYDELNRLSNRIAHGLIEKGIKKGDIVAFALPRRSYLIATMFGILKAGSAYMPIDPDYPQDRIDYMLEDSKAKFFITDNNFNEFVSDNEENPTVEMTSNSLCYCIYTSGTTGKPKGVLIRHRNLVNFCSVNIKNNLQSSICKNCNYILAIGSVAFDISIFEIILSLFLEKSVVLTGEEQLHNIHKLTNLISDCNVDCIHITPTRLEVLLENREFQNAFSTIEVIMIGGEELKKELKDKVLNYNKNIKIFNGYGPTETTLGVSFGEIR